MGRYVYAKGFREQFVQMMRFRGAPKCRVCNCAQRPELALRTVRAVAGYFALTASKYTGPNATTGKKASRQTLRSAKCAASPARI